MQDFESLVKKCVPSAVKASHSADFRDADYLNIALKLVDEFWSDAASGVVRYSTQRLNLERDLGSAGIRAIDGMAASALLSTFLAAEIELRIDSRLTLEQNRKLAEVFASLGRGFTRLQWADHAIYCYSRAARLFSDVRDFGAEDACWFEERRTVLSVSRGWGRWKLEFSYFATGFGYRPYRVLWVALIIFLFFALIRKIVDPSLSYSRCISFSSMAQLSAVSLSDIGDLSSAGQLVSMCQAALALIINTTFFALLVRKWFRA